MKEEIDENKEKEVIQKAYKYNGLLGIWIIAVFIIFFATNNKNYYRPIFNFRFWFNYFNLCDCASYPKS